MNGHQNKTVNCQLTCIYFSPTTVLNSDDNKDFCGLILAFSAKIHVPILNCNGIENTVCVRVVLSLFREVCWTDAEGPWVLFPQHGEWPLPSWEVNGYDLGSSRPSCILMSVVSTGYPDRQECIPVECVPPTAVAVGGGVWYLASSPSTSPLGVGLDQIPLNFPLGCVPEPDPPQPPTWVWAWTRSPLNFPLDCVPGPDPLNFPLGCGPGDPPGPGTSPWGQASPQTRHPPPVDRILDTRFWKYYLPPNFVCGR